MRLATAGMVWDGCGLNQSRSNQVKPGRTKILNDHNAPLTTEMSTKARHHPTDGDRSRINDALLVSG